MRRNVVRRWLVSAVSLFLAGLFVVAALAAMRWIVIQYGPGFHLEPVKTADLIAIAAAAIALAAFLAAFWFSRRTRQDALRVEKSQTYMNLEVASSEVFKYEAEKETELEPYRATYAPHEADLQNLLGKPNAKIAYNLYFQTLNLFEVCARFRNQNIIQPPIFASWIAWFYDTLDDWYFREVWQDLRGNYTADVRDIFDIGVAIFAKHGQEAAATPDAEDERNALRKQAFYEAVAGYMQCREIMDWLTETANVAIEAPQLRGPVSRQLYSLGIMKRPPPTRLLVSSSAASDGTAGT